MFLIYNYYQGRIQIYKLTKEKVSPSTPISRRCASYVVKQKPSKCLPLQLSPGNAKLSQPLNPPLIIMSERNPIYIIVIHFFMLCNFECICV